MNNSLIRSVSQARTRCVSQRLSLRLLSNWQAPHIQRNQGLHLCLTYQLTRGGANRQGSCTFFGFPLFLEAKYHSMGLHGNNSQHKHHTHKYIDRFSVPANIPSKEGFYYLLYQKYLVIFPQTIKGYEPYNVIVMAKKEPLRVFPRVVNHTDTSDKIHDFFRGGIVKIVPALVSPVAIDPF